jgi:hypothetical protein
MFGGRAGRSFGLSQFAKRLKALFVPGGSLEDEDALVSFPKAPTPDQTSSEDGSQAGIDSAIDQFRKAQEHSAGLALMSALTQTVVNSLKRLTQGQ